MKTWLNRFAYKIDIPAWVFIVTCLGAILLAFITTGLQSIKAAVANPANTLKTE